MISEERFKLLIALIISVALVLYHATNLLHPEDHDVFSIYKISQLAITVAFVFIAIYSQYLTKFILGSGYIAGGYEGNSKYYIREKDIDIPEEDKARKNKLKFTIKQNFFSTKISGKSLSIPDEEIVSTWYGNLFKIEDNTLYFALELSGKSGEFGILKLTFDEYDFHGFYYSGEAENKYTYRVFGNKVN